MITGSYKEAIAYLKEGEDVTVETVIPNKISFQDRIAGIPRLVVLGCGHVGMCAARLGKELGYHVTMADARKELADPALHPYADSVLFTPYEELWDRIPNIPETYVVLTVGEPALCFETSRDAMARKYTYVGLLGSRKKTEGVRNRLLMSGFSEEELKERFHAPVGIPLGGERPMEVALSILAEITLHRNRIQRMPMEPDIMEFLENRNEEGVLAVVTDVTGTAPRSVGSRMLVLRDGTIRGTIGGGDVEYEIMQYAAAMFLTGEKQAWIHRKHGGHADVGVLLISV